MKKLDNDFIEYFKINTTKQIHHMSTTIDDFRDFFKPEKEKSQFCVNNTINNILEMVNPIFTKNKIEIIFNTSTTIETLGYPNELGQAILNIINNAKDALIEKEIQDRLSK